MENKDDKMDKRASLYRQRLDNDEKAIEYIQDNYIKKKDIYELAVLIISILLFLSSIASWAYTMFFLTILAPFQIILMFLGCFAQLGLAFYLAKEVQSRAIKEVQF